ncbi:MULTISPECIES: hypothetical protein [Xanthomonas]|uniref:hypothetical protein n=1 Tax=Xanthomonas TaxID=338 RepID=UPI001ADCD369|nr:MULTISPECIES: hypothetical protein [unclassified Xanthomonas]MBO9874315.1 hypothetical protein [Xanthomonas sp. D-93]WNH46688.1 hypothetical protein PG878_09680 [Xanthomonas sp. A6251]
MSRRDRGLRAQRGAARPGVLCFGYFDQPPAAVKRFFAQAKKSDSRVSAKAVAVAVAIAVKAIAVEEGIHSRGTLRRG